MSANAERERTASRGDLPSLERNRFFYGKLMTPRDMHDEQEFHRVRFDTLARHVAGVGIVDGLETNEIHERRDRDGQETELEVTVQPGVAIDAAGRLLVVENTVRQEFTAPDNDDTVVHVYLRYRETETERVPTPDLGSAVTEGCEFNRIVESPEIVCRYYSDGATETQGVSKPVPTLDVDISLDTGETLAPTDTRLGELARGYRAATADLPFPDESAVFLGAFERSEGAWRATGAERRPLVYSNDMLYGALVRHVFDHDNPHRVTGGGGETGVPTELRERVADLETAVSELRDRVEHDEATISTLEGYVIDRSLEEAVQAFEAVTEEFESEAAHDIAKTLRERIEDDPFVGPEKYFELVGELVELATELRSEIRDEATEESLERYRRAVDRLDEVWSEERDKEETDRDILRVVLAQDRVSETASWLLIKLAVYR
ncbi:hypothetical protein NDI76_20480 [Halogeometricum sp. S1BR25-6]|uniref:Uncharacterized protein n=1 Tax=Halogeometricum salsisoli TaxID=2950536 RepID=A0ABU2GJX9_9EURY|nr:hypothetical protein [Halogeometricum sp. S1BR25-6]MDS0301117.1 hypothetical protein [Halogeometricum sp. S1BR25-6]